MTAKSDANGEDELPMYTFLKSRCPPVKDEIGDPAGFYWKPIKNGDITWNFNKFLIRPNGQPYKRYDSEVEPPAIKNDILEILADEVDDEQNELTVRDQFKRLLNNFQDEFYQA